MRDRTVSATALWIALAAACGGEEGPACQADYTARLDDGTCIGVDRPELCSGEFCLPDDAACDRIFYLSASASGDGGDGSEKNPFGELADATGSAGPGDCIAVGVGEYEAAPVGAGVSIFGTGIATVIRTRTGQGLSIAAGSGARVRGVRVTGAGWGIVARGVGDLRVEETLVDATTDVGIAALDGARVTIESTAVEATTGTAGYGLYADGDARIESSSVVVRDSAGAGIVNIGGAIDIRQTAVLSNDSYGIACQSSDAANAVTDSLVLENAGVGIFVSAARLTVVRTRVGLTRGLDGRARALEAQLGAEVEVVDSVLHESEQAGVLVDASRLRFTGGEIRDHAERGLWVQRIDETLLEGGESVRVDGATVCGNGLVGVGAKDAAGVVIQNGIVCGTRLSAIPDPDDVGAPLIESGDGVQVLGLSGMILDGVSFEGNERAHLLLDDAAGASGRSEVHDCHFAGNETAGVVIQNGVPPPPKAFTGNDDGAGNPVTPETRTDPLSAPAFDLQVSGSAIVVSATP